MLKNTMARVVAGTTSLGLAVGGAVLVGAATAPAAHAAKLRPTDYGLQTAAYGTRVYGGTLGADSGRSAWAWISCTNLAGIKRERTLAAVNAPADNPMVSIGGVDSSSRTFKNRKQGIVAASESTNSIARVTLGDPEDKTTPSLVLRGLESTSLAWADKSGKMHAKNTVSSLNLKLLNPPSETPQELKDLIAALEEGLAQVIDTVLGATGNEIEIPGLGKIMVGKEQKSSSKFHAAAKGAVLKVKLYGEDMTEGTPDDILVNLGHSWARVNSEVPNGIFHGKAWGASLKLANGLLEVGELGLQPMPCRGTEGKVRTQGVLDLDAGRLGQVEVGAVTGSVMGRPDKNGSALAWSRGRLASVKLGPLELHGVVGQANVKQNRKGKVVRRDIKGSSIGEVFMDGESLGAFDAETASQIPLDQLPPEVLGVKFFQEKKTKRSMHVSAIVITLAEGSPLGSEIRLGNAQVRIARN